MATTDHDEALRELRSACENANPRRVADLFATGSLGPADASQCLNHTMGCVSVMRRLLEHGADPMLYKLEPRTSSYRKGRGDLSIEVVKLLVEFGYDIKSTGHSILEDFVDSQEALDWLLDQGVDINRTRNAATLALTEGKRGYGSYNLRQRQYSVVVLNYAAARGDIRLFDHLVSRGADPQRSLALHYATRCLDTENCVAMIDHLLDTYGMDIHADNQKMRNYFHFADDSGKPLNTAIVAGNLPAIRKLLERGAKPDYVAVRCAIKYAYFEALPAGLDALLKSGANVDDALEQAAEEENAKAARVCLAYGADPDRILQRHRAYFENKTRGLVLDDHLERGFYDGEEEERFAQLENFLESVHDEGPVVHGEQSC